MARKNLVEVLQDLEQQRRNPAGPTVPDASLRREPSSAARAPRGGPALARLAPRAAVLKDPLVLALLALAFAMGFMLRGTPDPVRASGPASVESARPSGETPVTVPVTVPVTGPPTVPPSASTQDGYTVIAITYVDNERNRALAAETAAHFQREGLPGVDVLRLERSGSLVVVVGAAATRDELTSLRGAVRELADPAGREGQFRDAEIYPIESLTGN
jgi:hypothetical protein